METAEKDGHAILKLEFVFGFADEARECFAELQTIAQAMPLQTTALNGPSRK